MYPNTSLFASYTSYRIHGMSLCIGAHITGVFVHQYFCLCVFVMYRFFQSVWGSQGVRAGVTWDKSELEYERRRSRDCGWFCGRLVLHRDTERPTNRLRRRQTPSVYGALLLFQNATAAKIHSFNTIHCWDFSSLYLIKELSYISTYTRK